MKPDKRKRLPDGSDDRAEWDDARAGVARYIRDTSVEMRIIAHQAGLDLLAHILDLAVEEADTASGEQPDEHPPRH